MPLIIDSTEKLEDVYRESLEFAEGLNQLLIRDYLKPKNIIPAHGTMQQETPLVELAKELGYKFGETVHLSSDGKVLKF